MIRSLLQPARTTLRASLSRPRLAPSFPPSSLLWHPRSFSLSHPFLDAPDHPLPQHTLNGPKTPIGRIEPLDRRLRIEFTCTAPVPVQQGKDDARPCGHRSGHEFSKRSYDKGVVIVQCPECENRHLIADHLQWFSSTPSPANPTGQTFGAEQARNIETIMKERGEHVEWVVRERKEGDGGLTVEINPEVVGEGEGKEGAAEEVKLLG